MRSSLPCDSCRWVLFGVPTVRRSRCPRSVRNRSSVIADLILCLLLTLVANLDGSPTFLFVPNTGPIPDEYAGWYLTRAGMCFDHKCRPFPVEHATQGVKRDWFESLSRRICRKPYIVSFFVDLNEMTVADLMEAVAKCRVAWDSHQKAVFVSASTEGSISRIACHPLWRLLAARVNHWRPSWHHLALCCRRCQLGSWTEGDCSVICLSIP